MKYLCIHGHFYQPPRENPKTGRIDPQPSAQPFPDWNHRINDECYRANVQSPIIGADGEVAEYINNYSSISFNFGPTLLKWLEAVDPQTYQSIIEADKRSLTQFTHGTALAQVYHHAILPLCNARDKETETKWGIADFEYRFGRRPDGIWLAETAVDISTLEVLASNGIQFTLLAPGQARAVARVWGDRWEDVSPETLDTTQPYLVELPSGKSISVFFYDGQLAQAVAFSGALDNGERFAHQIRKVASRAKDDALLHYATDGESYGHHHRYGDMALAYCLRTVASFEEVEIINYASYLAKHPPSWKVQLQPVSAWSCAHGVGRWSENCGCVIDPKVSGKQEWRRHLRLALNWLRDQIDERTLSALSGEGLDLWSLRNHWHFAELQGKLDELLTQEAGHPLTDTEMRHIYRWMKIQRYRLMMFTSCGWFFDDPAGLECVQILRYAKMALKLIGDFELENSFVERLAEVQSVSETADGPSIWTELVCEEAGL